MIWIYLWILCYTLCLFDICWLQKGWSNSWWGLLVLLILFLNCLLIELIVLSVYLNMLFVIYLVLMLLLLVLLLLVLLFNLVYHLKLILILSLTLTKMSGMESVPITLIRFILTTWNSVISGTTIASFYYKILVIYFLFVIC